MVLGRLILHGCVSPAQYKEHPAVSSTPPFLWSAWGKLNVLCCQLSPLLVNL